MLGGGPGDIPIIHALYDTYAEWSELCIKFPKTQRFVLGERISQCILETLEHLIAAASTADASSKSSYLQSASTKIDLSKLLVRLAKDTKCISNDQYLRIESRLIDTGKMLGGWIKHTE